MKYLGKSRSEIEAEAEIAKAAQQDTFECAICMSPRSKGLAVRYYFNTGRSALVCLECASSIERMRRKLNGEEVAR